MIVRVGLVTLLTVVWVGAAWAEGTKTTGTYQSGGKTIAYERFVPGTPGKHPLIVLVHGADGLQFALINAYYDGYAQALARDGYVVFFPHYFNRTGTGLAGIGDMILNFGAWQKTIADGVTFAAKQPDVRPGPVGLLGFSLGASEAISLAAQDRRIGALVECFGGLPDGIAAQIKRMPPTLILHGGKDPIVSVKDAAKLEALLKSRRIPYEIKIYPNQGHGFGGADGIDALRRTLTFFDKHLKSAHPK